MSTYSSYAGHRMAYHLDGTTVYRIDTNNTITQLNSTQIGYLNDESTSSYAVGERAHIVFIFPQLRDLTHYFIGREGTSYNGGAGTFEISSDTTTGLDGSWSTIASPYVLGNNTVPNYRTINALSSSGIKAVRIENGSTYGGSLNFTAIHLFGTLSSGETPNRLDLWHPTLNQRVSASYFDFGDKQQSTVTNISFRVKNQSSTQTANTIVVSMATLTDLSPTAIGNYTLNLNGGSFASTQTISSLAPNATSDVLTLKLNNPSNAALSLWAGTVKALATSWT